MKVGETLVSTPGGAHIAWYGNIQGMDWLEGNVASYVMGTWRWSKHWPGGSKLLHWIA